METIKHECGVALIRLLKPLSYYKEKYGTWGYGFNKLYLLMEKQHNRGQEAAGFAALKMQAAPGEEFLFRERAQGSDAISKVFESANRQIAEFLSDHSAAGIASSGAQAVVQADTRAGEQAGAQAGAAEGEDPDYFEKRVPFAGEVYLGHLRYSTTGRSGMEYVHPFIRRSNFRSRSLCLCGNFNLTNVQEIFRDVTGSGQHPRKYADTYLLLEQLGFRLDREVERLFRQFDGDGRTGCEITRLIEDNMVIENVLRSSAPSWDGGYCICGMTGSGESFAVRDPWGIRPAFYYRDDEIVVLASERPVIQTVLRVSGDAVKELEPGQSLVVSRSGEVRLSQIMPAKTVAKCSFERIYFSRGNDADIYRERKMLGRLLTDKVFRACDEDLEHSVISFIPNTAEVAYLGLVDGLRKLGKGEVRAEKLVAKDIKLRTFISEGESRNDLAAHVYDVTYGVVREGVDTLVVIDDSIVRGTTLRQSIIKILDTLHPRKIVVVSSSPQVRYPDCYGIDMSRMGEFAAFRAVIELLRSRGMEDVITETYRKCKAQENLPKEQVINYVKDLYAPFSDEELSERMALMLKDADVKAEVQLIFQDLDGLHRACPGHSGDWYFTGDYPTPGGNRVVNNAFVNWYEGNDNRRID